MGHVSAEPTWVNKLANRKPSQASAPSFGLANTLNTFSVYAVQNFLF